MTKKRVTRRAALKVGGAAMAAPYIIPNSALGNDATPPASERVNVGIIGLGGRARSIARSCGTVAGIQIQAVCDCFQFEVDRFAHAYGKDQKWGLYTDFRKMIEEQKLDGVMIETTTHARGWITVIALQMGMDAYIEKPMALTIQEGRHMAKAAEKYKRVTQIGTQQRSMPLNNWVSDQVKSGVLGKGLHVLAPNFVGPEFYKPMPKQPLPRGGTKEAWDIWTNQATPRPYHPAIHHGWNKYWAYDGGGPCYGVTGWGTHSIDQVQRALGTDLTGPTEIELLEPVANKRTGEWKTPEGRKDTGSRYRGLARNVVGPRAKVRMKYANGVELKLELDGDYGPGLGAIFVGENGTIELNRDNVIADPAELINSPDRPDPLRVDENNPHIQNWVDCIKSREKCTADIEIGQRSTTVCYMINLAREVGRVGETLKWDPDAEKFTNFTDANDSSYIHRPRREGYELPELT